MHQKSRRSQHSLYSRTTEHPAAAFMSSSFVCHTLIAPPGQVSLRGYSIHSPRDKWRHRLLPPPFMRQIETCVKEIHFCTFSKCSVGGHQLRNHPDYSSICVNGQREFLFFYRTAKNLQSPLFHRQSFHLQGSGRDPAALLPAKWRARLCIFSLPFFLNMHSSFELFRT